MTNIDRYIKDLEEIIDAAQTALSDLKDQVECTIGALSMAAIKARLRHFPEKPKGS